MSGEIDITLANLLDAVNGEAITEARLNQMLQGITASVQADAITDREIAEGAIDAVAIEDGSITTAKLTDGSVTTAKLADQAATSQKIADLAISTSKLQATAVTEAKLANDAVTTAKIKDVNVTTAKIADTNVTEAKLATDAVTTAKIKDVNVTTAKIADANVTLAKLATNAVPQVLQAVKTDTQNITALESWTDVTGLSQAITPQSSSNKVMITACVSVAAVTAGTASIGLRVLRDATPICIGDTSSTRTRVSTFFTLDGSLFGNLNFAFLDSPATGSSVTYKIQLFRVVGSSSICVNEVNAAADDPSWLVAASTLTLQEELVQ